jgi:hypothetical protein
MDQCFVNLSWYWDPPFPPSSIYKLSKAYAKNKNPTTLHNHTRTEVYLLTDQNMHIRLASSPKGF